MDSSSDSKAVGRCWLDDRLRPRNYSIPTHYIERILSHSHPQTVPRCLVWRPLGTLRKGSGGAGEWSGRPGEVRDERRQRASLRASLETSAGSPPNVQEAPRRAPPDHCSVAILDQRTATRVVAVGRSGGPTPDGVRPAACRRWGPS
jgi:hypothetical protein